MSAVRPCQHLRRCCDLSCTHIVCLDCGDLLPLGTARDTPRVLIEIRAAEIAAAWAHGLPFELKLAEIRGDVGHLWPQIAES